MVFFTFLKYSKLKIGIFYSAEYFFAFSHSFKYHKFFAAKTLTQMSHLFSIAGLGPIVFFYRWITGPGVLLGCFLVLTWCGFLLTDWILLFSWLVTEFPIYLMTDGLPLVFSASVPLASVSSYCRGDSDQFILEMASYSPMTLLLLLFFFMFD